MDLSIFEAMMIISFGIAWPANIIKSYRARTNKGKSFFFLIIVFFGYISGITHKIIYSRDIVMIAYILNLLMVGTDLLLYFRNSRLDKKAEKAALLKDAETAEAAK